MSRDDSGAGDGAHELRLRIELGEDADAEEAERLTRQLRSELDGIGVDVAIPRPDRQAPAGAKGGAIDWGTLLVALTASGGAFTLVIATVRDWLARSRSAQGISMTIDGDTISLDRASPREREELLRAWVSKHSLAGGSQP